MQRHSELIFGLYQDHTKMPKAARKSMGDKGDDIPLHGTINEEEAKEQYSSNLDNIVINLGIDIKEEVNDAMKWAMIEYKEVMTKHGARNGYG